MICTTTIVYQQLVKISNKIGTCQLTKGVACKNVREDLNAVLLSGIHNVSTEFNAITFSRVLVKIELSVDLKIN